MFFFIVVHVARNLHFFKGPNRRVQRVRLFLCSFVLYMPWIPGEHRRGIWAGECVAAHLRGFEEDSRSEVVFCIDEWSIEFGHHWLMLLMFLTAHLFQSCDHAGFRADNNDVYLSSKELDEKVARLHISAHVEALKQIVRIRARVPLHLQPSTATHIVTHTRRAACSTHRYTYALKSWGGLPRCDLAPQSTSFGTVALRERQHLAMAAASSPEVVGWAPPV